MQDAQLPTEPEDEASESPRRASLRLRDAEAVASVRRDMFGDGSLLDTLAGSPPAPRHAEPAPPAPAEPPADGRASAQATEPAAAPAPLTDVGQALDAIIDSFPAEPATGAPPPPGGDQPEAISPPMPPDAATAPAGEAPASQALSDPPMTILVPQMGVSSLFDSLGSIGTRAADPPPVEAPPAPSEPPVELDMSMLEMLGQPVRSAVEPQPQDNPPISAATPEIAPAPPVHQGPPADAVQAEATAPSIEEPPAPSSPTLDLDMSMLERPLARPVLQAEEDLYVQPPPFPDRGFRTDSVRGGAGEPNEPRTVDQAYASAADGQIEPEAPAPDAGEPPFADGASAPPSPEWVPPSFPERSGAAALPWQTGADRPPNDMLNDMLNDRPNDMEPPQAAPANEPTHPLHYAEPTAMPEYRGYVEPANDRGVPEPLVMPAYPEPTYTPQTYAHQTYTEQSYTEQTYAQPAYTEPAYTEPGYTEPAEGAAQPMFNAATKIAAEAQATADALNNLKRLVVHSGVQDSGQARYGTSASQMRLNLHGDPTPFPSGRPAALIPMPLPLSSERSQFRGIYALGFLTGLGLAVIAGVALYLLINIG